MNLNKVFKISAVVAILSGMCLFTTNGQETPTNNATPAPGRVDQIYFNSYNVVDYFYYGDTTRNENNAYYITYDDIDAGHDYAVIRVDLSTFKTIETAVNSGRTIEGNFIANYDFETVIYKLVEE